MPDLAGHCFLRTALRNSLRKPQQPSPMAAFLSFWGLILRLRLAQNIRSVWLCAAVSLAMFCGYGVTGIHAQDAAATASGTTPAEAQPAATAKRKTTSHSAITTKSRYRNSRSSSRRRTARGQQKIDPERAHEIQQALIRAHYLSPKAEGTWNQDSEDAMRRYQADHGWQSKTVPDSRALISLGLGPSHDHLLNPESAMTSDPTPAHETRSAATSMHASVSASPASSSTPPAKSQPDPSSASQPAPTDPPHPQ